MPDNSPSTELAIKRGGPVTPEGKAIVRGNAIKHGILANVIPEHEAEAYEAHVEAVHDHYQPLGYVEEALAERIATALWRLGRVVRYESAQVRSDTERGINSYHQPDTGLDALLSNLGGSSPYSKPPKHPDELQDDITGIARGLELHRLGPVELAERDAATLQVWVLGAFGYAFDSSDYHRDAYRTAMNAINKLHGIKPKEADWLEQVQEYDEVLSWDFAKASKAIEMLMSVGGRLKLPDGWQEVDDRLSWRLTSWRAQLKGVLERHTQIQAHEGVPSPHVTDKLAKYEAHIERTLYRAMHELEAMQDRRLGKQAPLARVEVHGME